MNLKNQIKSFFQKVPKILAERAFPVFLLLVFLGLIVSAILFYRCCFRTEKIEPKIVGEQVCLKEKIHQKILEEWLDREQRYKEADFKVYPNLFLAVTEEPLEITTSTAYAEPELEESKPKEDEFQPEIENQPVEEQFFPGAQTLFEFYAAQGRYLPSLIERAKIWEEMDIGAASDYHGSYFQNIKLLEALKLTE